MKDKPNKKNTKKFNKEASFSEFWTNNEINIQKLAGEIKLAIDVYSWEECSDEIGYSGISMVDYDDYVKEKKDAKRVIFVHWTNVGKKDGFNINFDKTLYIYKV